MRCGFIRTRPSEFGPAARIQRRNLNGYHYVGEGGANRPFPLDLNYRYDNSMKAKTVSLVLGSGGARGLAHIGVIQWLEERHFDIQSIDKLGNTLPIAVAQLYPLEIIADFITG